MVTPFLDKRHGTERALAELLVRLAERWGWEIVVYAQRVQDLPNVEKASRLTLRGRDNKVVARDSSALAGRSPQRKIVWRRRASDNEVRGARPSISNSFDEDRGVFAS